MNGSFARAREALRSRDFSLLLACRLVSQLADGFFQAYLVAEIVFLNPEGHSTAAGVAKAYAVLVVPYSILGPLAGVLIDRWSRRRILQVSALVKTVAALALMPLGGGSLVLYAPALLVVSMNRFFLATATSSIPALVSEENLLMANSMSTVGGTVATFVGIVAGTKLANPLGGVGLLAVAAACWPVSAFLATRIRRSLRPSGVRTARGHSLRSELGSALRDLRSGARRLAATPSAVAPISAISFDQFLIGFVTVLSLVVFKQEFHQGVGSYGNIVAAGGVGIFAGTLTVGWLENRLSKPRIVAGAFAVAAAACLAVAPVIGGLTILLVSFVLGLTFAWRKIPVDTMVQEAVPDRFRGRVFAVYDIAYSMARVAAAGLAVVLIPHVSTAWLLAATGAAYLLWSPVVPWWTRRPMAVAVRFSSGGRADEVPRSIAVAGEEEAVVDVLRSAVEERSGERIRRFDVRTRADERITIVGPADGEGRWRIERWTEGKNDGDVHAASDGTEGP